MSGRDGNKPLERTGEPGRRNWWRRLRPEERKALSTLGLLCAGVVLFGLSIELGSLLHHLLSS